MRPYSPETEREQGNTTLNIKITQQHSTDDVSMSNNTSILPVPSQSNTYTDNDNSISNVELQALKNRHLFKTNNDT